MVPASSGASASTDFLFGTRLNRMNPLSGSLRLAETVYRKPSRSREHSSRIAVHGSPAPVTFTVVQPKQEGNYMKAFAKSAILASAAAMSLGLAACDSPTENAAEDQADAVRDSAEATADAIEETADAMDPAVDGVDSRAENAMENKADAVRDAGEAKADAMEDNADKLPN
jgi:vacuolar-type H+-ATPase subunit H